jgi:hypothetical protein
MSSVRTVSLWSKNQRWELLNMKQEYSVLGVLATGPKGCGFEPSQGNGFLRVIEIHNTPSSQMGSKAERSHVKRFYGI